MNPDKPTAKSVTEKIDSEPPQRGETGSQEDLAAAPDHDVPNEVVIEKTLPEPAHDKQEPQ